MPRKKVINDVVVKKPVKNNIIDSMIKDTDNEVMIFIFNFLLVKLKLI